ncbi:hypothetical protein [Streptomyces sp. GbtcB7]|uniref:hypothetical protein n=1 Tax=Streptomyces sp. GbtcB7 TaxID=2824752 RepID=UPI001C308FE9|nr:hypothetical protein [Streptomyces sp. GbtcB7]
MKVGLQYAEPDRERTWSNDTTHAIHASQTLRIERVHEAHPTRDLVLPGCPTPTTGQRLFVLRGLLPDDADHRLPHPAPQTPGAEGGQ